MEYMRVRKTDLARNTSQIIRNVLRGQPTVIENHGQPEVAIVDVIDYLILRALAHFHAGNLAPWTQMGHPTQSLPGWICKCAITAPWNIIWQSNAAPGGWRNCFKSPGLICASGSIAWGYRCFWARAP